MPAPSEDLGQAAGRDGGVGLEVPQRVGEVRRDGERRQQRGRRHALERHPDPGRDPQRQQAEADQVGHERGGVRDSQRL